MNALKKTLTILGAVILVLTVALVGVALYAINRKEQNHERIKAAAANRWPEKPKPDEHSKPVEMVASRSATGGGDPGDPQGLPMEQVSSAGS